MGGLAGGHYVWFLYGFLILEEKESEVFSYFQVLPLSASMLVRSRMLVGFGVSTLVNFMIFHWGGLIALGILQHLLLALLYSLNAPLITLLLIILAQNRVQGLAQMKIINMLLMLPGLIFFIPSPWIHLTGLIPTYWLFRSVAEPDQFELFYCLAAAIYLLLLGFLQYRFGKKIFKEESTVQG
ncbi:MAG: hypothetical protein HC880_17880 [Bacteroidia bacterium]|nr:hypothetical protein [Bacteroidia bacterium]